MSIVSYLIFVIFPTNLLGHTLDTMCLTQLPTSLPVTSLSYIGIVGGFDKDADLFYRRTAGTKSYDKGEERERCNQRSSDVEKASCGFGGTVQISNVSHYEGVIGGRVTMTYGENDVDEQKASFGVYNCITTKYNFTEISTVTILSPEAVFQPKSFTITVNLEDRVRLIVTPSRNTAIENIRWRRISETAVEEKSDWAGNPAPVIGKTSITDGGVYEVYTVVPDEGPSGYIRLIVRGCRFNLWGSTLSCEWTCAVCYNGGICDDKSGRCICPPGFTGDQCEKGCPDGFIGKVCDVQCSLISDTTDCNGIEICLPDPFGCTCAPGYTGIDCTAECASGFYGAGCTQMCHCNMSEFCDVKSGRCSMDGCETGWGGPMCQVKVLDVYGYGFPAAVNTDKGNHKSQVEVFTSLTTARNDTRLRITRGVNTENGPAGSGLSNHDANRTINGNDDTGLPQGSLFFLPHERGGQKLRLQSFNHLIESRGVFFAEAEYNGRKQYSAVLRLSNQAQNIPSKFTWTVGTGETVTLSISGSSRLSQLRWRHNDGDEITRAQGSKNLTIFKARKSDEGVYVCRNGLVDDLVVMLLKVRACPSGTWGVYCNNTCPVCHYQGICQDETGECVCQAGYHGRDCSQICGNSGYDRHNLFGQQCNLRCEDTSQSRCRYKQICSPDPVGCHCRAGYTNSKCAEQCRYPNFGTDCSMVANCNVLDYDAISGCKNENDCTNGFQGQGCQVKSTFEQCSGEYYGILCNYPCHCKVSNQCDRMTGSCGQQGCAEGWTGNNCSNALPSLLNAPVANIFDYEVLVIWDLWRSGVDYGVGPVEHYVVKYEKDGASSGTVNVTNYSVLIDGLDPLETYAISVAAVKEVDGINTVGPYSTTVRVRSACGRPNFSPKIENVSQSDNVGLLITWNVEAPQMWMECSPSIRVYYRIATSDYTGEYETNDYRATQREIDLQLLRPCKLYEVTMAVVYRNGKTSLKATSKEATTSSSGILPEIVLREPNITQTSITITWEWQPVDGDTEATPNFDGSQYNLNIIMETPDHTLITATYNLAQQSFTSTDLVANTTYVFNMTVEDCTGLKGPVESVEITTRPFAATPVPEFRKPQSSTFSFLIPISGSFLILLIVVVVFLIIIIKKRNKQNYTTKRKLENSTETVNKSSEMTTVTSAAENDIYYTNLGSNATSVALTDLHNYVQSKKLETDGFKKELSLAITVDDSSKSICRPSPIIRAMNVAWTLPRELVKGIQKPCTVGEAEVNVKKNRFKNIVTYDHSRVKLPIINDDPSSDYFNASYINGYDKLKAFIASQGPNKASLNDFWRMVWHVRCEKIIMVTNTVEAGKTKCLQYWSDDNKPRSFADITVQTANQDRKGEVVTRYFKLSMDEEVRHVTQYHFTGWPDMKVPPSADVLWEILDEVEKDEKTISPPIVVHCSAGCGRTGTIITLSAMRKMLLKEGKIDVFGFVSDMREQRPAMVQTQDQYEFIYESLMTYGLVGKTSIRATEFSNALRIMKSLDGDQSKLEKQFHVLKYLDPFLNQFYEQIGAMPINVKKNRFPDMIPIESYRPKLMTNTDDPNETDYINASFCDGYKQKDLFLATQLPLPDTTVDFWRLVFDYQCFVIVLLQHGSNKDSASYFPVESRSQYGPFTVEAIERDDFRDLTRRTFRLSKTDKYYLGEAKPYLITQFSLDQSIMEDKPNLLDLVEKVQVEHRKQKGGRIALLCWNGVDENSVFIAVYNSCARLRDDGVVNLFSVVHELRERSPKMVGTMEQYEFCMDAIQDQIESTSLYANT